MTRIKLFIILLLAVSPAFSQEYIISEQSVLKRAALVTQRPVNQQKMYAEEFAREMQIPLRYVSSDGTIIEIQKISENGLPMYYKTFNLNAAKTTSTNKVWEGGEAGLSLDGEGIVVGVWDGGPIRVTHAEFQNRVRLVDDKNDESAYHSTHVAGTIGAAGLKLGARGMANKCKIDGYSWTDDNAEMREAAQDGMLLSNHSYGFIQGWNYSTEEDRWEWFGDVDISETEDYNFGFYDEDAAIWDDIAYDNPFYLIVKSAGNDRGEGPLPGTRHYVWSGSGWIRSNKIRDIDGRNSFDCIGSQGTSKNILTVGAVNDIELGYMDPEEVEIAYFSVFGPTDDGRIKPDIVGNGVALNSTISSSDNAYGSSSGTSMSSPNITGSLALLQEHYHELHGVYMFSSMMKALTLHTADDAGNPGPDYKFGWGLMNTAAGAKIITDAGLENFFTDTLKNATKNEYTFFSTGEEDIKITIVWTDPAGTPPPIQLDPTKTMLVNDLDLRVLRNIDGREYKPYILDPANPDKPAFNGDNRRDNVEQILIPTPLAGYYTIKVSHKQMLKFDEQPYSVVVTGMEKEYNASGLIKKKAVNGELLLTSGKQYKGNMDVKWLIEPENNMPATVYFDFFATEAGNDVLRIYDGSADTDPLLAEFSGALANPDTIVKASGPNMLVSFATDGANENEGFKGFYCTQEPSGIFTIEGNAFPCESSIEPYFAIGEAGAQYSWTNNEDWTQVSKLGYGVDLTVGTTGTNLLLLPYNACGTAVEVQKTITSLSSPPVLNQLVGDTVPCLGTATKFTTDSLAGVNYNWILPFEWSGESVSSSLTLIPSKGDEILRVSAENSCGTGNMLEIVLSVLDVPEEEVILTEKTPLCVGSVQDFFVENISGNECQWEVFGDWELLDGDKRDTALIVVGSVANFIQVTTNNKCGSNESSTLFQTASLPDAPILVSETNKFGYPVLSISNSKAFAGLKWYYNGIEILGNSSAENSFTATRNGVYTAASVSDKECVYLLDNEKGIVVNNDIFTFVAYRVNETSIGIENTLSSEVEISIFSLYGRIVFVGMLQPGYNELPFSQKGAFLMRFSGYGDASSLKTVL